MSDPLVTRVVDADGVLRWGSVDAKWVAEATGPAPAPAPAASPPESKEVPAGATEDAADGDGQDPVSVRRRP